MKREKTIGGCLRGRFESHTEHLSCVVYQIANGQRAPTTLFNSTLYIRKCLNLRSSVMREVCEVPLRKDGTGRRPPNRKDPNTITA